MIIVLFCFNPKKLPCFYATNNQRSLECDLTSKNSFLMPPISKYFLIQPNWFPLLELIKKKIAILGTAALPVHGDVSLWYCCYNFLNYIKQAFRRKIFNCTYPSHGTVEINPVLSNLNTPRTSKLGWRYLEANKIDRNELQIRKNSQKGTGTKMAEKLNKFEKFEKKIKFQTCSQPRDPLNDWPVWW